MYGTDAGHFNAINCRLTACSQLHKTHQSSGQIQRVVAVSTSLDSQIRIWDLEQLKQHRVMDAGAGTSPRSLQLTRTVHTSHHRVAANDLNCDSFCIPIV